MPSFRGASAWFLWLRYLVVAGWLIACSRITPTPTPAPPTRSPAPLPRAINLDADTQTLIANADRVVFIIPFSHWDTDWHEAYPAYVKRSDGNILKAIELAEADGRFRYALEQVLFVQHFWDTYPEHHARLQAVIQKRQLTFAWAGITQPETSLVAPAIQVRNLQLGQQWIAETFGPEFVPHSAWQSDAFGNSAALPLFLNQSAISNMYIGRWQHRCDPDFQDCVPLPHAFYWSTPLAPAARVLVAYSSYPSAWDNIHRLASEDEQLTALRSYIQEQFARTESKYVFMPMGSDFIDPLPNVMSLVDKWNAADKAMVLVVADPETAFDYLATQTLPEFTVDLNPIWQAFYNSRPFAKIADKESEYYLTTADKFGALTDAPASAAWLTATLNAHYDNIGAVSFDWVWEGTQRPRYEQTLATAAEDAAATLASIASGVAAPLIVFNPSSWPRSEVMELYGDLPDVRGLNTQVIGLKHVAVYAANIPAVGFSTLATATVNYPARVSALGENFTLSNGLVSVTLDATRGGTFSELKTADGANLLTGPGDNLRYWNDTGDIYGARFGEMLWQASDVPAQITILADGPLLARAQATLDLGGVSLTKTVTLRADSALIEVTLDIRALPETSVLTHTPTTLTAEQRTDDTGFAPFTHLIDRLPVTTGDLTYRRKIFYPIVYWSDITHDDLGLTFITHGLQGIAGTDAFNLMLVRSVTDDDGEGVTDLGVHSLRYAYSPHSGTLPQAPALAEAFNQPLIPVWRTATNLIVSLSFTTPRQFDLLLNGPVFPNSFSLLSAEHGRVIDIYKQDGETLAVVLGDDPAQPVTINWRGRPMTVTVNGMALVALP